MASKTIYDPHVTAELAIAIEKSRPDSPCREAIAKAFMCVANNKPVLDTVEHIVEAMCRNSNSTINYSLSQAIAWIGPMGE